MKFVNLKCRSIMLCLLLVTAFSNAATQVEDVPECPACDLVGNDLLHILHNTCGTAITTENLNGIKRSSPMFALMIGIKNIDENAYKTFRNSAEDSLQCDNLDSWTDRAKISFMQAMAETRH